jgi:hypothetical protein
MRALARAGPLVLALLLAGCASGPDAPFRALSSRPVPILGYRLAGATVTRDVEAVVVSHVILWIPTRVSPPTVQEAVDKALQRGNGDVLVNAWVDRVWWYIPFVYGQEGWRVHGDVVRLPHAEQEASPAPETPPEEPPPNASPSAPPTP